MSVSLQHITNPRKAKGHQDLVVNNPLSQDEGVSESLSAHFSSFKTVTRCSWRVTDASSFWRESKTVFFFKSILRSATLKTSGIAGVASSNP